MSFKPCKSSPRFQWGFHTSSTKRFPGPGPACLASSEAEPSPEARAKAARPTRQLDTPSLPGDGGRLEATLPQHEAEPGERSPPRPRGTDTKGGSALLRPGCTGRTALGKGSSNPGRSTPLQSPPTLGGEEEDEDESSLLGMGPYQPLCLGVQDGR